MSWKPSELPYDVEFETKAVLKKLAGAHRALAELKGLALTIPRPEILTLTIYNWSNLIVSLPNSAQLLKRLP